MPAADKCHLNIPFKEYFRSLQPRPRAREMMLATLNRSESSDAITQPLLDRVASDEFENYKAIERRVNADCGRCACSFVHAEADTDSLVLIPTSLQNTVSVDLTWATIFEQAGGWSISSGRLIAPDPTFLHRVTVNVQFSQISGTSPVAGAIQITDDFEYWFAASIHMVAGFEGEATMTRLADMSIPGAGGGFTISAILDGARPPAAGSTRTMGVYAELWAVQTCCTSPYLA